MQLTTKLLKFFILPLATLCVLPAWAQSVGRVLVASGDVTVVRGNASQPATAGFALLKGDRVRTGAAGNAQLWFTDSSILALRSGSDFVIEHYEYRGETAGSLVFQLLKGGYRTVAGLIGLKEPKDYRVKTPIATVGRRGTQYGIVYCAQDCPLPAGGLAPDGLYGGVYDGRVSVANNTPEKLFGRDEYFYVASIDSIPSPLLGPPGFFADRLQGLARNAQKPASEPAASPAKSGEGEPQKPDDSTPALAAAIGFTATENRNASGGLAVATSTTPTAVIVAHSMLQTNGQPGPYGGGGVVPGNLLRITGSGSNRTLIGYDVNSLGLTTQGSLGSGTVTMQGYDAATGTNWGRWVGGSVQHGDAAPGPQTPGTGLHYLLGTPYDSVALAAKTGQFSFSDIGGTTPTSSAGETASSFAVGSAIIDFTQRTGTLSSLSIVFPTSQWSYSNVGFQLLSPNTTSQIRGSAPNVGSCVGSACGPAQGTNTAALELHGMFLGSANNFGLAIEGRSGSSPPSPAAAFSMIRVFGNPQPYTPPPQPPQVLVFAGSMVETNGSRASYGGAVTVPAANLTTSGSGPTQVLTAFNIPQATFSGSAGASAIDMVGFDALSGVYYGRWITGSLTSGANQQPLLAPGTQTSGMGVHYLYGSPTPDTVIAAKTGTFQYVDYVGTTPTTSSGETTNNFSIGPIDINFTNRTGVIQSVLAEFPSTTWFFQNLAFSLNVSPGQGASFSGNLPNSGGCFGSACGPIQGSNTARADFEGRFIGASGHFLGLTFHGNSGGNTPSGNPNLTFGMVRLFKCPTCP